MAAFVVRQPRRFADLAYSHPLWPVRYRLLTTSKTLPLSELQQLNGDARPEVRRLAARYRSVDKEMNVLLEEDRFVRAQAMASIRQPAPQAPGTLRSQKGVLIPVFCFLAFGVANLLQGFADQREVTAAATNQARREFGQPVQRISVDGRLAVSAEQDPALGPQLLIVIEAGSQSLRIRTLTLIVKDEPTENLEWMTG